MKRCEHFILWIAIAIYVASEALHELAEAVWSALERLEGTHE